MTGTEFLKNYVKIHELSLWWVLRGWRRPDDLIEAGVLSSPVRCLERKCNFWFLLELKSFLKTQAFCSYLFEHSDIFCTSFLLLWLSFFSMFMASIWLRNERLLVFSMTCWYGDTALLPITTWPCRGPQHSLNSLIDVLDIRVFN